MAGTPFEPCPPNVFDIYTDATATPRHAPGLPCGRCNFVDLTPGANGARCGCRRFWARQAAASPVSDQAGWCMCNHHACYHDHGSRDQQLTEGNTARWENERPGTGREALSPVLGMPVKTSSAVPGVLFPSFGGGPSFVPDLLDDHARRSTVTPSQQPPASMPDTWAWGCFVQSPAPANTNALPPIPPQCLLPMPSQSASTSSSVRAGYLRPFAGNGLQTLGPSHGAKSPPSLSQPLREPLAVTQHGTSGSALLVCPEEQAVASPEPGEATQLEPRTAAVPGAIALESLRGLTNTVGDHGKRLDRLETVSFHEECHDRFENLDVRMSELESRIDEVEKPANDSASVVNTRGAQNEDAAAQSVVSASTSVATHTAGSQDVMGHIHSLRAQVTQLQSYLPSLSHAWEVEIVFLPFPLKRLWQDIHLFESDASAADSDDWTQLPMTHSTATRRSQSPFCSDWATTDHDADWLLPRACGNTSVMDKRLRSRGLVQTASIKGPDYRSVQVAVCAAFGNVFREMKMQPRLHSLDPRCARFLGLQQSWVPLRKIHKDSRLRFLSPAEMMTPGLWDVQFLNSVIMRSSEPRLFITHPDAYLQDQQAYETGWTWQRVREMIRVYPDVTESQEVPEADALEACWAWSEQLDDVPSAHTSMSMRRQRRGVSTSPLLARSHSARSWRRSTSPAVAPGPSPLLTGRRDSVPPHIRIASAPLGAAARRSPGSGRLGVVPCGQSRRSSPAGLLKRRRTRSPSVPDLTPRWTASPSPMPAGLGDRQARRGTTPFAYATPYSNAPVQERRAVRGGSVARTGLDGELPGIEMYESGSDESYANAGDDHGDDDESVTSEEEARQVGGSHAERGPRPWRLPEDEPWPGIEDEGRISDGENIKPRGQEDAQSEASSQPSEYPSTNRAWPVDEGAGFHIHEDGDD